MASFEHQPPVTLTDPAGDDWTQGFWDAAAEGRLVVTRCSACQTFRVPPGRFCRACGSQEFTFEPVPGTGTVFACTVVRQPLAAQDADGFAPYVPAVIDVDGAPGARLVSAVVDCAPDDVAPGMKVRVVFDTVSDALTIPYWAPA